MNNDTSTRLKVHTAINVTKINNYKYEHITNQDIL
jgi:hypothetical protein